MKTSFAVLALAAVVAADDKDACTIAIGKAVTPYFNNTAAVACAKVLSGTNMANVFLAGASSADQTKLLASADCNTWYTGLAAAVKAINPPCTYYVNDQPVYKTDAFNWTFAEFLQQNNAASQNATTTTPKVTTKAPSATNATNQTTTTAPSSIATPEPSSASPSVSSATSTTAAPTTTPKSSAASSAVAVTALAAALYMANN
ncbi:hypothetical protein LEN26_010028 [Aphanomyces euteiches]|nr:hypothetical protein AeMF1_012718 [Aphanomyces euteiches]KAH9123071.1 hypothetical protein LEN26_010028 [Aphanomyces euteiches]KAH9190840.1 hypothetical protein AeNC1_007188 [Aphanomyces euteiches]